MAEPSGSALNAAEASTDACTFIEHLAFTTDAGFGARARIGLVALQSDYTVEAELAAIYGQLDGVAHYVSRVSNDMYVTPDTLAAMGPRLTASAAQLLAPGDLDVIAYGCTSASTVLGTDAVERYVRASHPDAAVTNPLSAASTALSALGVGRVAVLTPYTRDINEQLLRAFQDRGFSVPVFGSFNEPMDPVVAAIDATSLTHAAETLLGSAAAEALFVSCTSVRLASIAGQLEARFGVPVLSSNLALAWHCLRLAGVNDILEGYGRLFQQD
ncbi:MAG: aspartate/glutamate racemase family protein [Pseudomonadota bacterium]